MKKITPTDEKVYMTECSICFENITNSSRANCDHNFCHSCIMKWCNSGGITCPMCRKRMFQVIQTNEIEVGMKPVDKQNKILLFNLDTEEEIPGMILSRLDDEKNPGLIIYYMDEFSVFKRHFKEGDKILYLNGIPCIHAREAVDIINHTYGRRGILKIEIPDDGVKSKCKRTKKLLFDYYRDCCFGWVYKMLN